MPVLIINRAEVSRFSGTEVDGNLREVGAYLWENDPPPSNFTAWTPPPAGDSLSCNRCDINRFVVSRGNPGLCSSITHSSSSAARHLYKGRRGCSGFAFAMRYPTGTSTVAQMTGFILALVAEQQQYAIDNRPLS